MSPASRPRSYWKDDKLDDLITNPTNSDELHTSPRKDIADTCSKLGIDKGRQNINIQSDQ